jgi:hypothetical protein
MMVCRGLLIAAAVLTLPVSHAAAQFGGMPGMPGASPGPGFGAPPQAPPRACQQLVVLRDEAQKNAGAIQAANERKAPVQEACRLFKVFAASEFKMMKAIEENMAVCGIPADVPKQLKAGHAKTTQITKEVCDAAAMGPRPSGPSLSDVLGTTPTVPDSTRRGGAFDTLTGNALAR